MACTDCFNNCGNTRTTDRCVEYTGADIPLLGICKGDSLFEVEVIILEKLQAVADGTGVDLSSVTIGCSFLTDILDGEDQTLANLVQMLSTATCSLHTMVAAIQTELAVPISVDAACLTLPTSPTRDQILVATVTKLCSVATDVAAIKADYVKSTELCAAVAACLSSTTTQEYTKMPKYVALPYMGSLSVFDSTGKGLAAFGYDKVYICNGNNGTQDLRGRTLVGANTNVVGPALDAAVDPSVVLNAGYSFAQNTKRGAYTDILTVTTMPAHGHSVTDGGHTHPFQETHANSYTGAPTSSVAGSGATSPSVYTYATQSATTGLIINSTGSGQPHNNTQPSFGVVYIAYFP
jgi:microcystin-dependent protein